MQSKTLLLDSGASRSRAFRRDVVLITGFALALWAGTQIRFHLPWTPVPVTAQTFIVAMAGLLLGADRGRIAVLLYLSGGAAGLPVFSNGTGGLSALAGPTAGYLVAMPIAAWLCGKLSDRGWGRSVRGTFTAAVLSSIVVLILGTAWLTLSSGSLASAFSMGFLPFVPGELVKSALISAIVPSLWILMPRDTV